MTDAAMNLERKPLLRADEMPDFARNAINLASAGLGARGVSATDEFFAPLVRMLQDSSPVFITDKYDDHGKWMDGWETRRRRGPGHDWIVIALGVRGTISRAVVDTAYFKGNFPDSCSIQATDLGTIGVDIGDDNIKGSEEWPTLLNQQKLSADAVHEFLDNQLSDHGPVTHVRLNIFPDGGVSRLRLFGRAS